MGRNKSLLAHPDGGRFIDHAIEQLQAVCEEVCIAGAADAKPGDLDPIFLTDDVAHQGPVTGIVNALEHASKHNFDACFVTPVDMPWLTHVQLATLTDAWSTKQVLTCGIDDANKLQPLVAIYPEETIEQLRELSQSSDRSLYRWIATQPHQTVRLPGNSNRNINRPDDLH